MTDAAGSETWIQYNADGTNFGASADFTWDDGSKALVVEGTINAIDATGDQFYMDGGVMYMWAAGPGGFNTGGRVVCSDSVLINDDTLSANVTVSGGAVTAVDLYSAGFMMANGSATFTSGLNEDSYDASIVADYDSASVTVYADSNPLGYFQVIAGTSGIEAATLGGVLVVGATVDGGSQQYLTDVEFEVDFSPYGGMSSQKNGLIFATTPLDGGFIDSQATFADAYNGQLFIHNGQAVIFDWMHDFSDGGSVIEVGRPFPVDTYTGYIHLLAESYGDAAAEEIFLISGTGTTINCQKLGFFGTAPVVLQLVPNHTAVGGSFDDATAAMLNAVYTALLNYGLIGYM